MQGKLSQIFYLGPIFHFMQSRKKGFNNVQKLPVFLHKMKTNAEIKSLRHASLNRNIESIYRKCQFVNL